MNFKKILLIVVAAISLVSCKDDQTNIILFSSANVIFPKAGGEIPIGIDCEEAWSVTIPEGSWIKSVNPMSGKGSATVKITVEENTSGERRTTEIGFNSQLLLIVQEAGVDVNPTSLYGVWEDEDSKFKFTFNEDKTCSATVMGGNHVGTYALVGNIITITINDSPKKIAVAIDDITKNTLVATMGKQTLILKKK